MKKKLILICIDGLAAYYLRDPSLLEKLQIPTLRKLMAEGVYSTNMQVAYPSSTWPMHTTLITGTYPNKHGVLGNWVVNRNQKEVVNFFGDRDVDKEKVVRVPTLYDVLKEKGLTTASLCWPVTRGAINIDFNIPEFYDQNLFETYSTPQFWHELKLLGFPVNHYALWSKDHKRGKMQDWLTTEIALYLIKNYQPNLLMTHFLVVDSYQHDYGTRTDEVLWAIEYIDERIGKIVSCLEENNMREDTDIVIVSDHGFHDTDYIVCPNVLFKQKGWLNPTDLKKSRVFSVSNGGCGYVYLLQDDETDEFREEVKRAILQTEGVEAIYENEHYQFLGLPTVEENANQPDFIFECQERYFVYKGFEGDKVIDKHKKHKAMHGFLPFKQEMNALFIGNGPSFLSRGELDNIHLVDIAPTLANIFDIQLNHADGDILSNALKTNSVFEGGGSH